MRQVATRQGRRRHQSRGGTSGADFEPSRPTSRWRAPSSTRWRGLQRRPRPARRDRRRPARWARRRPRARRRAPGRRQRRDLPRLQAPARSGAAGTSTAPATREGQALARDMQARLTPPAASSQRPMRQRASARSVPELAAPPGGAGRERCSAGREDQRGAPRAGSRRCSPSAATSPRSWCGSQSHLDAPGRAAARRPARSASRSTSCSRRVHREFNTIASKSADLEVTNLTLDARARSRSCASRCRTWSEAAHSYRTKDGGMAARPLSRPQGSCIESRSMLITISGEPGQRQDDGGPAVGAAARAAARLRRRPVSAGSGGRGLSLAGVQRAVRAGSLDRPRARRGDGGARAAGRRRSSKGAWRDFSRSENGLDALKVWLDGQRRDVRARRVAQREGSDWQRGAGGEPRPPGLRRQALPGDLRLRPRRHQRSTTCPGQRRPDAGGARRTTRRGGRAGASAAAGAIGMSRTTLIEQGARLPQRRRHRPDPPRLRLLRRACTRGRSGARASPTSSIRSRWPASSPS